jgi:hypothetical protein
MQDVSLESLSFQTFISTTAERIVIVGCPTPVSLAVLGHIKVLLLQVDFASFIGRVVRSPYTPTLNTPTLITESE